MQNLYETLKGKTVEELRTLAKQQGMTPHHRAKPETLARQIAEKVNAKPSNPRARQPQREAKEVHEMTQDEVRQIVPATVALQFPGDGTFIMTCRGAEESMSLTASEKVIATKSRIISRGALKPVKMDFDGTMIMRAG